MGHSKECYPFKTAIGENKPTKNCHCPFNRKGETKYVECNISQLFNLTSLYSLKVWQTRNICVFFKISHWH